MPALPYHAIPHHAPSAIQRAATSSRANAPQKHPRGPVLTVHSHGYVYMVSGSQLLSAQDVRAALQAASGPRAAIGGLKQAYQKQGYFLVAVVGRMRGKRVQVRVVQGRLTHVDGPARLTRFFSALKGDDTVKNSDVIRQSTLAQEYAATNGQQPQISFKPAPEFGGSRMHIGEKPLKDYSPVGGSVTFGNFGNRYAGHYLAQAQAYARHDGYTFQVTHARALTGLDANTRGAYYSSTGASLSDVTPLGTYTLNYDYTRFQLGQAFAPLFPLGRIKHFGLAGTQLLYADGDSRWTLDEGVQHIRDTETVFSGAYTLREQNYTVYHLGSDYAWRFGGLFKHAASLSVGGSVKLGGASGNNGFPHGTGAPTPHFQLYTGHASVVQSLAHDVSLKLDLSGQASTDTLPEYQQWVLGGLNNLTAYLPGTIVGDRGYLGRLTLQGPQWTVGPLHMRPSVFAEHGAARHSFIPAQSPMWQRLTDAGLGLSMRLPVAHTSATLAYARPLDAHNVARKLRRGQRAHLFFYLQIAY